MKLMLTFATVFFLLFVQIIKAQGINTLRFGIVYSYPPFVKQDALGNSYGYDVEIAKSLCAELGKACEFTTMPFADLFSALNNNQVDAIISAISITETRKKTIDFTHPYYQGTASFLTLSTHQPSTVFRNALKKSRLGALSGTIYYDYLVKKFPLAKVIKFANSEDAIGALADKKVDSVLLDTLNAKWWLSRSANLFQLVVPPEPLPEQYGIAVKKNNIGLLNDLNKALNRLFENGKITEINQIYIDFEMR